MNKLFLKVSKFIDIIFPKAAVPFTDKILKQKGEGFHYQDKEFIHYSRIPHHENAFYIFSSAQIWLLISVLFLIVLGIYLNWIITLRFLFSILTIIYFADLIFNLILIIQSFTTNLEIRIDREELTNLNDKLLPLYTILCPLYHETAVLPQFITAMSRLDYPKDRLQILLLLEEDDLDSLNSINSYNLPGYFRTMIVPHSLPKTKPKAINFGLKKARGKYVVVYDAEDIPEPDQLKKVILSFKNTDNKTICLQAKLNFYNPRQNILTRIFTAEYSLWFELILSGLNSFHAVFPLGGTSNHFKTAVLKKIGGWDAFNVTEDCDLGIRLVKKGYRAAIFDSITFEEANSNLVNWFKQRTRWLKGYLQTYLVQMRSPQLPTSRKKLFYLLVLQLTIGGKVVSIFVNQLLWIITLSYFAFRGSFAATIETLFPSPFFYLAIFSLLFGNFLYLYYYIIGSAKRGDDDLIKYVFFVPFYWLGMSLSAWYAVYQLARRPFFWEKTRHGLHLEKKLASVEKPATLDNKLTDFGFIGLPSAIYNEALDNKN